MFGLDIAAFTAIEMAENGDSGHPNEIAFSSSNKAYKEDWSGDKSGISLYKAAANLNTARSGRVGLYSANRPDAVSTALELYAGYLSGCEAGRTLTTVMRALSFSYMWTNEYKAPWHIEMDKFYQNDKKPKSIICTRWARSTTSKTTWCWKRHLVRLKAISISILPRPAINLISRVAR
jgi:hypothetical protein